MISMKVLDVKTFMSSLLVHSVFDQFLLCELDITTFTHFHLSGNLNKEWYLTEEIESLEGRNYSLWSEIKPYAFQIMKGNKTPYSFKIVLQLGKENTQNIIEKNGLNYNLEEMNGLFLNIRYEQNILHLITGTSQKTFTLDKSVEHVWDVYVKSFLKQNNMEAEEE